MTISSGTLAVTGAGGFIGLRLVERAVALGYQVKGLEVSAEGAARASRAGAEVIVGSVTDATAVNSLVQGTKGVIHTAAVVEAGGDVARFREVNVGGTGIVAAAAKAAGAARLIHLSSVMVYGFRFPNGVSEDHPLTRDSNPYCATKVESERVALSYHEPPHFHVIALRPGDVYGTGSVPWVLSPLDFMKKKQFILPNGGRGTMNHLHIDNLVDAMFLALATPHTGTSYNLTDGQNTSFRAFYERLAAVADLPMPPVVPMVIASPLLRAMEGIDRLRGRKPKPIRESLRFLTRPHPYSVEKARRLLGYAPRVTLDEGFAEIGESLRAVREPGAKDGVEGAPSETGRSP